MECIAQQLRAFRRREVEVLVKSSPAHLWLLFPIIKSSATRPLVIKLFSELTLLWNRLQVLSVSMRFHSLTGVSHVCSISEKSSTRFHARRVVGGHSDHRNFSWLVVASSSSGTRGCTKNAVQQQHEANWIGFHESRVGPQVSAEGAL